MLGSEIVPPFDREEGGTSGPGGWWILHEPEVHLHDEILVPDLAGWRRSRMPSLPDSAFFVVPPDWLCEIVSPATERLDRGRKRLIYAREGVSHLWLLSPSARTLEVFRLSSGTWILLNTFEGDETIHAVLDLMYARAPIETLQRAVHIHPTVSELLPTIAIELKPLA